MTWNSYNQNGAADDRNEPAGAVDYADQDSGGQGQLNLELREDADKGRQSEEDQHQHHPGGNHQDHGGVDHGGAHPAQGIQVAAQVHGELLEGCFQVPGDFRHPDQVDV